MHSHMTHFHFYYSFCPATCVDSRDCRTASAAMAVQGRDICKDVTLNHFCNYTCGLCPGQTTKGICSFFSSNDWTVKEGHLESLAI